MRRVYCFADEAGLYAPCNCICVSLVCFEAESLYYAARSLVEQLYSLLGWKRGELKWRSVKKASARRGVALDAILRLVDNHAVYVAWQCAHLTDSSLLRPLKEELLDALASSIPSGSAYLVVDEGLVSGDSVLGALRRRYGLLRARFASSRKTPGLQVADLVAGYASERVEPPGCGSS